MRSAVVVLAVLAVFGWLGAASVARADGGDGDAVGGGKPIPMVAATSPEAAFAAMVAVAFAGDDLAPEVVQRCADHPRVVYRHAAGALREVRVVRCDRLGAVALVVGWPHAWWAIEVDLEVEGCGAGHCMTRTIVGTTVPPLHGGGALRVVFVVEEAHVSHVDGGTSSMSRGTRVVRCTRERAPRCRWER